MNFNRPTFIDHPRSGVIYNFGRVCQTITFESMGVWTIWRIELCYRRLRHVTRSDHAKLNARIRGWSALD